MFLSLLALPLSALAGVPEGLGWLTTQQSANGSFGGTAASLATEVRSTAEVIRAYQELGQQSQPAYAPSLGFLNNDTADQARFLAGKIVVNAKAGNNVTALVSALVAYQNPDGAFGDRSEDDASAVFDTALALEALTLAGVSDAAIIAPAVGFLLSRQQASGGWADGENVPSVSLTAFSLSALQRFTFTYNVSASVDKAREFLFAAQAPGGGWGEDWQTALTLLAVVPVTTDVARYAPAVTLLQSRQLANGSWGNDAYTTALDTDSSGSLTCLPSAQCRRIETKQGREGIRVSSCH